MSENNSTSSARIRALKTSMVSLLRVERDEVIPVQQLKKGVDLLIEAYQEMLNDGTKQLMAESPEQLGNTIMKMGDAYTDWRTIDSALSEGLNMAYTGQISRDHLQIDSIQEDLTERVGEPLSLLYSKLIGSRSDHLSAFPWDSHMMPGVEHVETEKVNQDLHALVHGDHLDVEDAIVELTGSLKHFFSLLLREQSETLDSVEESLWMRPEIVVMNDYWGRSSQTRILDFLRKNGNSRISGAFAKVQDFFAAANGSGEDIVNTLKRVSPGERETYLRCLMLHPDQTVRRYAANNVDVEGFWKVVSPEMVPCATVLTMVERIASSTRYDENFQKIFFDTVWRRLLRLTARTDVFYARGILQIFSKLPFFMEDPYFDRITLLIDYVAAKERYFNIDGGLVQEYLSQLRREKEKIGSLQTHSPSLSSIPPVILRKLARDGHYWYDLAAHPMFKIARETIPHIYSEQRAIRIANNHVVNQDVLRAVGKRTGLFGSLPAKVALLSNPRTPPSVSLNYIVDLTQGDVHQLLRKGSLHPELRAQLLSRKVRR